MAAPLEGGAISDVRMGVVFHPLMASNAGIRPAYEG